MKRFHVHVAVSDLAASIRFYNTVFGRQPDVEKPDYAKWMLEDPRVNFAISTQAQGRQGLDHLGLQVDSAEELTALHASLAAADAGLVAEENAVCCYARSDKYWVTDPNGIAWESFHTLDSVPVFGQDRRAELMASHGACCAPQDTVEPVAATTAQATAPAKAACCTPAAAQGMAAMMSGGRCG